MKPADRSDFKSHLKVLCAAMDVPCTDEREEAFWRGLQEMHLAVFIRTVDFMLAEEEWTKMPKPAQIWAASKRMRSAGPTKSVDDGWRGDDWDIAANRHLLAYLLGRTREDPQRYGRPATCAAMRASPKDLLQLGLDPHNLDASPDFVDNVQRLVAAKNQWAADMRQYGKACPVDVQRQCWDQRMAEAEGDIAQRMAA